VAAFLEAHGLADGRTLLVGVSGGPDSVALLHALAGLREALPVRLHAAHLDHGLRGRESRADAEYVAGLCERLGVPLISKRVDVAAFRHRLGLSMEDAARRVRYGFFAEAGKKAGARVVLVGHTADDQVETVLLHLLRGSGVAGLAGMEALARAPSAGDGEAAPLLVGRPLLGVSRRETEAYCAAHRLGPRRDSSNRSPRFLRNRVRRELLPVLRRYNPSIDAALLRLAEQAALTARHLDRQVEQVWPRLARPEQGAVVLDRAELAALDPALQAHALRRAVAQVKGDLQGIAAAHIRRVAELAAGPAGRSASLPGGIRFVTGYERHRLGRRGEAAPAAPALRGETRLRVPGTTYAGGWRVRATTEAADAELRSAGCVALLDVALARRALVVRSRRPGDRFRPLGMAQAKKLQDFFVDAKVPREARDAVPLVCADGEIVWVVGYRIGEAARVPAGALRRLRLELTPRGPGTSASPALG